MMTQNEQEWDAQQKVDGGRGAWYSERGFIWTSGKDSADIDADADN